MIIKEIRTSHVIGSKPIRLLAEKEPPAKCVCPECDAIVNSSGKHCNEIKCPKCGAEMRAQKPGTGGGEGKGGPGE